MNPDIVDIDESNAQQYLIDESASRPVLVDFWADWCSPCKALLPILEKLVTEFQGQFLLAKVDCDKLQQLAAQFGVRNLPSVVLMKDGQPVDGFTGLQPESAIRELLEKHLPKPWETQFQQALQLLEQQQAEEALVLLKQAWTDSGQRADIAMSYAETLLQLNRSEDAESVLNSIPMVDQDSNFERLMAMLELKQQAADTPEIQALQQKLTQSPDDPELRFELAIQLSQVGRQREAMELLMGILKDDREFRDGEARRILLDIIRTLGKGDPLAAEYQRRLFAMMY